MDIQEERNKVYEQFITLIRKTAEDEKLRKEQKLTIIKQMFAELDEKLWVLNVKEAKDTWHTASAF